MTPPKAFPEEKTGVVAFDIQNQVIREEIRPLVFALGEKHGLKVLDLYALTEEHPEYFCDGVHPNSLGNQVIARFLRDRLDP
jgi:lysophospholipase L1-like esterase